jgi:hypothetical protein
VPAGVGEPQLRAGVGAFLADDHPHPIRPADQVGQPSELGDPDARRTWLPAEKIILTGNTIVEATLGMLLDEHTAREIVAKFGA